MNDDRMTPEALAEIANRANLVVKNHEDWSVAAAVMLAGHDVPKLIAEVRRLRAENDAYKADVEAGRLIRIPCREFYENTGGIAWLVWEGEVIETVQCGAQIDPEGKLYVVLVCEDKIFPYRTPIAEYDMEMSDWCTNDKAVDAEDYQRTVFMTEEAARAALGKEREDG